jgi:hypothetical protein
MPEVFFGLAEFVGGGAQVGIVVRGAMLEDAVPFVAKRAEPLLLPLEAPLGSWGDDGTDGRVPGPECCFSDRLGPVGVRCWPGGT